jgi:hypothetical protein
MRPKRKVIRISAAIEVVIIIIIIIRWSRVIRDKKSTGPHDDHDHTDNDDANINRDKLKTGKMKVKDVSSLYGFSSRH